MQATSVRTYLLVYAGLLGLTAATVGAAFLPLGLFAPIAALGIAGGKAALVLFRFMHVRESPRAAWVLAAAGLVWLLVLLGPVLVDVELRSQVPGPGSDPFPPDQGERRDRERTLPLPDRDVVTVTALPSGDREGTDLDLHLDLNLESGSTPDGESTSDAARCPGPRDRQPGELQRDAFLGTGDTPGVRASQPGES